MPLQIDELQFLYLKKKYVKIVQNYLHGAILNNICSKSILETIIKISVAEFIFSKLSCFVLFK